MKIYPYLSYRREINETDVNYTCNLQKVWDSSDSLNGNSCSLFIFIRSTIPMISGDFLTRWNAITVGKGRGKGQFLGISYFWIEVLGLLSYEGAIFIPNLSSSCETVCKYYCRTGIQYLSTICEYGVFIVVILMTFPRRLAQHMEGRCLLSNGITVS